MKPWQRQQKSSVAEGNRDVQPPTQQNRLRISDTPFSSSRSTAASTVANNKTDPLTSLDTGLVNEYFTLYHALHPLTQPTYPHHSVAREITAVLEGLRMTVTTVPVNNDDVVLARRELECALRCHMTSSNNGSDSLMGDDLSQRLQECLLGKPVYESTTSSDQNRKEVDPKTDIVGRFLEYAQFSTTLPNSAAAPSSRTSYLDKPCYALTRMNEIIPGLFCGSYHPAADKELLQKHNVTHIVCCINVAPRFPTDFRYMVLAADDSPNYDMSVHFDETVKFIAGALMGRPQPTTTTLETMTQTASGGDITKKAGSVLVHCGAGISRAPSIVAAFLIATLRMSAPQAIQYIQRIRSCASPNQGFRKQLAKYASDVGAGIRCHPTREFEG